LVQFIGLMDEMALVEDKVEDKVEDRVKQYG
jgi:hypothetical protein